MIFHLPVSVGDVLCCYCEPIRIGRTSIKVKIEVWAQRAYSDLREKVTEGVFTYVHIDSNRKPREFVKS